MCVLHFKNLLFAKKAIIFKGERGPTFKLLGQLFHSPVDGCCNISQSRLYHHRPPFLVMQQLAGGGIEF
jgi:hypothetical protein